MTETMTAPRTVTLTIPGTPAYALSPNSRKHWRVKYRESVDARLTTFAALQDTTTDPASFGVHGPVKLIWVINLAKRRKLMDRTNATATLKPFEDALVELGVIDADTPDIVTGIEIHQNLYQCHGIAEGEIKCTIRPA